MLGAAWPSGHSSAALWLALRSLPELSRLDMQGKVAVSDGRNALVLSERAALAALQLDVHARGGRVEDDREEGGDDEGICSGDAL